MAKLNFKRHRFPPHIIRYAIRLYFRYTLSLRDVEDILAERGISVSYENDTVLDDEVRITVTVSKLGHPLIS